MRSLFVVLLIVHVLLSLSIFDIWFRTPVVPGMVAEVPRDAGLAKRLVLVSLDGARADYLFSAAARDLADERSGRSNVVDQPQPESKPTMPYMRELLEGGACWGVSHAHVPTETRPGHVALIAGMYEDPSSVTTGWQNNPVAADTLFNNSAVTFQFGAPDVVPMFSMGVKHVHSFTWPEELNDWGVRDTPQHVDNWVFHHLRKLFNESSTNSTLWELLHQDKAILFLHLLGVDAAGHMFRPSGEHYLDALVNVDEGLRAAVRRVEEYYGDGETAFAIVSDHGMSARGSHGDGSVEETQSPLILFGKGFRNCSLDDPRRSRALFPGFLVPDEVARGSFRMPPARYDVEQADIVPLLASVLGIAIPRHSVGLLYTDALDASEIQLTSSHQRNAAHLLNYVETLKQRVEDSYLLPVSHYVLPPSVTAQNTTAEFLEYSRIILRGIRYYRTYSWPEKIGLVLLCYAATMLLSSIHLMSPGAAGSVADVDGRLFWLWFTRLSAAIGTVVYLQGRHPTAVLYAISLSLLVALCRSTRTKALQGFTVRGSITESALPTLVAVAMVACVALSYSVRPMLSVGMLFSAVPLYRVAAITKERSTRLVHLSAAAACLCAIFPVLPPGASTDEAMVRGGLHIMTVLWTAAFYYHPASPMRGSVMGSSSLLRAAVPAALFSVQAEVGWLFDMELHAGEGSVRNLLFVCNWCVFATGLATLLFQRTFLKLLQRGKLVGINPPRGAVLQRAFFAIWSLNLLISPMFIYVEVLFMVCFSLWLLALLPLMASQLPHLRSAEVAAMAQVLLTASFFGCNNLSSVSSFDPRCVYRLQVVFQVWVMMSLLMIKVMAPLVAVIVVFVASWKYCGYSPWRLFAGSLIAADVLAIYFFLQVSDEGSWKDIGQAISKYVICTAQTLYLFVLGGVAHFVLR